MSFLNIMLCYHFSLEAVLQGMAQKFEIDNKACVSMKTDGRENVKFIITNFKDRFTSYITTAYPNMFSFGLCLLFLRFLLLILSMCLVAGKDIAQTLLLF